jgi:hypothetical protein
MYDGAYVATAAWIDGHTLRARGACEAGRGISVSWFSIVLGSESKSLYHGG